MSEIDICTNCQRIIPKGRTLCNECIEKEREKKEKEQAKEELLLKN